MNLAQRLAAALTVAIGLIAAGVYGADSLSGALVEGRWYGPRLIGGPPETITKAPEHQGLKANAPVPVSMHQKNDASFGLGNCVPSSIKVCLRYQGLNQEAEVLWQKAHQRPGGYHPEKLARMLAEPGLSHVKYQSYTGGNPEFLDRWNSKGFPMGITYGAGQRYGGRIAHMVTLSHIDQSWGAIIDNNFPGEWSWMPRPELVRRWRLNGGGWAVVVVSPAPPRLRGLALGWGSLIACGSVSLACLVYFARVQTEVHR